MLDLQTKLKLAERVHARQNLLAFTAYTKPDYAANWHHTELARKLDRVARGECTRLMIFMPPQHGKSELVSRRFPAFMLGRNPELRLISASHTADLAVSLNRDVQRIMTSEPYAKLFETGLQGSAAAPAGGQHAGQDGRQLVPVAAGGWMGRRQRAQRARRSAAGGSVTGGKLLARRTMDLFEIPGHRGSLRSAGVGSSIAGNRADGAIIDDPFGKREDAESPQVRKRVWEWYTSDLYTRLSTEAWVVLTHTRWHRDDLAGRLLRKMAGRASDQWEVLCLPAFREEGEGALGVDSSDLDSSDLRTPGEPLWPAFKSAADLEIIRQQDPRAFAALYQQNPADASAAEWAPELFGDWMWVPPEKWPRKFDLRVVCVDASKGRSDRQGDYSVIVFVGVHAGLLYVDAILERIPLDQIVRKTVVFCDQMQPHLVGFEAEQFQELLVHEFRRQCGENSRWPIYKMMTQGVPKIGRIRRLSQYVINRELRFRADSPGCRLLVDQLMDFPLADHDDGPDALEMCTRLPVEVYR